MTHCIKLLHHWLVSVVYILEVQVYKSTLEVHNVLVVDSSFLNLQETLQAYT